MAKNLGEPRKMTHTWQDTYLLYVICYNIGKFCKKYLVFYKLVTCNLFHKAILSLQYKQDFADFFQSSGPPLAVGAGVFCVVLLFIVVICIHITRKRKKEEKKTDEDMVVDENPVYHKYVLVGPNFERQYSICEVVDNNDYYG